MSGGWAKAVVIRNAPDWKESARVWREERRLDPPLFWLPLLWETDARRIRGWHAMIRPRRSREMRTSRSVGFVNLPMASHAAFAAKPGSHVARDRRCHWFVRFVAAPFRATPGWRSSGRCGFHPGTIGA